MPIVGQKQKFHHRPEDGVYGDCHRTAVAMLLGRDRETVPHAHRDHDADSWYDEVQRLSEELGVGYLDVAYGAPDDTADEQIKWMIEMGLRRGHGVPFMLCGKSPRGVDHAVVIDERGVMYDPAPDGGGLSGPATDDVYWISWVIPIAGKYRPPPPEATLPV